MLWLRGNGLPS